MKSKSPQNFIAAVCSNSDVLQNGYVVEDKVAKIYLPDVTPVGPANASETDIVLSSNGESRKLIYLDRDSSKRKYDDMTSSRIEDLEAWNDHEVSATLSYFREHRKRRPPEAGNLMHLREATALELENELHARTSDSRFRSVSRVEITPEICGESDLTAEDHMAEESSRSSNDDDSSLFENAAESVSKGSNMEFRHVSSLGDNRRNGGGDVSALRPCSEGPSHMSRPLVKNAVHSLPPNQMEDVKVRERVPESDPATNRHFGSGSTEAPSSVTSMVPSQLWGRGNSEWLQLGVGASSNIQLNPASGEEGMTSSSARRHEEMVFLNRKITTSIDFPITPDREANSGIFPENSNGTPGEWQFRRGSNVIPRRYEGSSDPSVNPNPATFPSLPISSLIRSAAASEVVGGSSGKPDFSIFGRRLIQTGAARHELVLAPLSCSGTRQSCTDPFEKDDGMATIDNSFELGRDQDDHGFMSRTARDERFDKSSLRMSEIHNRAEPSIRSTSTPIADVQLTSVQAAAAGTSMDHDTFQCHRDSPPSSISALQRRRDDLRPGQVGHSWLPPPAPDLAPKLIPTAENFQGWTSSELNSTAKLMAVGGNNAAIDIPLEKQAMIGSDEWGSLFRKLSPKMLFQSQCHQPAGSSVFQVQSAGHETNVGSQEHLVALKRAIENIQKRPQWPIQPHTIDGSVASWCLSGNPHRVRSDSKLEFIGEERQLMSSIISESGLVHSSYAGNHLNLREEPHQRQSWQPFAGHAKVDHGNVNALQRPSPQTAGKSKFQVLPRGSRGANRAGLWFILQSAENQNGEGGLPQISKAYLRIKDGKMPVSAVKKYLVSKLGLTSESEVEITCKGQPVVPSLPLQHVRDVIWFSSLNANGNSKEQTSSGEREESATSASEQRSRPPTTTDRAAAPAGMFSKDILMVLTYRRHPQTLQLSTLLT